MNDNDVIKDTIPCHNCDGSGFVEIQNGPETETARCSVCGGKGYIIADKLDIIADKLDLSICMIVGKEESNLKRCLDSLLPIIHERWCELIVVVTQEGDLTFDVAREYTDKVYFEKWENNFSKHRNSSISHATGKKILIMDADEELSQRSLYILEDIVLNQNDAKTVFFNIKSFYTRDLKQYADMMQPRLFINDGKPIYDGIVHNKPRCVEPFYMAKDIEINHYGYMFDDNPELKKQKNDRSLPLLEAEHEQKPDDIHVLTHLIKTYFVDNQLDKVKEKGEKWIKLMSGAKERGEYHDGWSSFLEVFEKLVTAYVQTDDINNALRIAKEAEKYSKYLSCMYFNIGYYYAAKEQPDKCAEYLEHGLKMIDECKNQFMDLMTTNLKMIVPEVMNWLSIYYFRIGNYERSGKYLNNGIEFNENRLPLRWDIWNEPTVGHRLVKNLVLNSDYKKYKEEQDDLEKQLAQ